ncbi:hypothetical protein AAIA71_04410 [Vibrio harveyi]|uniref:hypothetical protein n=1 Tax=Vibrio harveyi TaxID=669 RepID=UPI0031BBB666
MISSINQANLNQPLRTYAAYIAQSSFSTKSRKRDGSQKPKPAQPQYNASVYKRIA